MMKTIQHYLIFCFLPTLFTACGVGDNLAMLPETDESGKLTVSFDLNGAGIRMDDATDTRANANVPLENLADGTLFSIRAYKKTYNDKGELTATIFADAGVYKVESGGKTANAYTSVTDAVLQLTRGIYDLYFLSYNSSTVYPGATGDTETITGSTLADVTSKDVIATSMKDVQIQSDQDGQVTLTIPMDGARLQPPLLARKGTAGYPPEPTGNCTWSQCSENHYETPVWHCRLQLAEGDTVYHRREEQFGRFDREWRFVRYRQFDRSSHPLFFRCLPLSAE